MTAGHDISFETLVDYAIGEVDPELEQAVDRHLFECDECSSQLEWLLGAADGVARVVTAGQISVAATADLIDHLRGRGFAVRQYIVRPGEAVRCTAAPDDLFVAIGLADLPAAGETVNVEVGFEDLETGTLRQTSADSVPVDAVRRESVVLYPGDVVRSYPRSRWTMRATVATGQGVETRGPYVLEHTPWEQLDEHDRTRL